MTLYIVATPIGNLEDITLRALKILRSVERICCEDTRRTKILLNHYSISKKNVTALHHHSSDKILESVIKDLENGDDVAYLTDAGTPSIADPGGKLVALALKKEIKVVPIPGPSSIISLLSVSGLPADRFVFAGFVPTKKGRQSFIKELMVYDETVVFFETAPRLTKLLDSMVNLGFKDRVMIVGRELTKQFEEVRSATIEEHLEYYNFCPAKGELTLVLSRSD